MLESFGDGLCLLDWMVKHEASRLQASEASASSSSTTGVAEQFENSKSKKTTSKKKSHRSKKTTKESSSTLSSAMVSSGNDDEKVSSKSKLSKSSNVKMDGCASEGDTVNSRSHRARSADTPKREEDPTRKSSLKSKVVVVDSAQSSSSSAEPSGHHGDTEEKVQLSPSKANNRKDRTASSSRKMTVKREREEPLTTVDNGRKPEKVPKLETHHRPVADSNHTVIADSKIKAAGDENSSSSTSSTASSSSSSALSLPAGNDSGSRSVACTAPDTFADSAKVAVIRNSSSNNNNNNNNKAACTETPNRMTKSVSSDLEQRLFLASKGSAQPNILSSPPTYFHTEMHQHQHQHTHMHQYPVLPPFFTGPTCANAMIGFPPYPTFPGFAYPAIANPLAMQNNSPATVVQPKKKGKWCSMHVQIAWDIYNKIKQRGGKQRSGDVKKELEPKSNVHLPKEEEEESSKLTMLAANTVERLQQDKEKNRQSPAGMFVNGKVPAVVNGLNAEVQKDCLTVPTLALSEAGNIDLSTRRELMHERLMTPFPGSEKFFPPPPGGFAAVNIRPPPLLPFFPTNSSELAFAAAAAAAAANQSLTDRLLLAHAPTTPFIPNLGMNHGVPGLGPPAPNNLLELERRLAAGVGGAGVGAGGTGSCFDPSASSSSSTLASSSSSLLFSNLLQRERLELEQRSRLIMGRAPPAEASFLLSSPRPPTPAAAAHVPHTAPPLSLVPHPPGSGTHLATVDSLRLAMLSAAAAAAISNNNTTTNTTASNGQQQQFGAVNGGGGGAGSKYNPAAVNSFSSTLELLARQKRESMLGSVSHAAHGRFAENKQTSTLDQKRNKQAENNKRI
ncbi:hypothetical protein T02_13116 [Trichinella nativa]|uniref:Uncharacterized protein n=1 Tax=Trichinella nativa TaxID=6335 RepID=A0A0V1LVL9_9BILA|nr:hypothetical protein T02_13116 [Trichinella nativa]